VPSPAGDYRYSASSLPVWVTEGSSGASVYHVAMSLALGVEALIERAACWKPDTSRRSITRWLCARVGPGGRVLATDLDTRFVEELDHKNLDVCRMDLRTDELPADAFDLVHARLVLMHIPQREQILDALLATLRPGGWLLLEKGPAWGRRP
jgi:SAM-dependent methyltransferase